MFAYPRAQPVGAAAVLQRAGETAGDGRAFGLATYHGVIAWRTRATPDGPLGPEERQEVWFGGPGRLRVAFERGVVVRDGAVVWYYQPASKTAARLDPATTFGGDGEGAFIPAGTAAMLGRATDTFDATLAGEEVVAGRVARIVELRRRAPLLAPRSAEERTVVRRLWIDRDTYQLLGGEDRDGAGDTITAWRYASLEVNPALDAALFAFAPPADAHVVDARATPSPAR